MLKGLQRLKKSYALVASRNLHRDLAYLVQLLDHPDKDVRTATETRLQKLTGQKAGWKTWYATHKGKLLWDASAGIYTPEK